MSQTIPLTARLGPAYASQAIGYRVLNLDESEFSPFTTVDFGETSIPGTYRAADGILAPDEGGYVVIGTAILDVVEATVNPAAAGGGAGESLNLGGIWQVGQQNEITFTLVDPDGNLVAGLGSSFTLALSKSGGSFNASAGTKAEIGGGWYSYLSTDSEADTIGPVSIRVTHASITQRNLEYVVKQRTVGGIEYTYTLTNSVTTNPIVGAQIWFTTDIAGVKIAWYGTTDIFGVARDGAGRLPRLDTGTYYVWRRATGFVFNDPDVEVVS